MNRSELVLNIVLEHANALNSLSAKEVTVFMTSCKAANNSEKLKKIRSKHRAWSLYDNAWYKMEEATMVLQSWRTMKDLDLSRKLFDEHKDYVSTFVNETDDVKDCLSNILTAEYKELLYDLANNNIDNSVYYHYNFIFQYFKDEMLVNLTFCNLHTHIHDPTHYAFMDIDHEYYKFYANIEKHKKHIFQDDVCKEYIDMVECDDE